MSDYSSPFLPSEKTDSRNSDPVRVKQRIRYFELGLVLFVAFAGSVAISVYTVFSGASLYGPQPSSALSFVGVIEEVAALGVLF